MKNILPLIKDFKRVNRSSFLMLILGLLSLNSFAQSTPAQVSVTVNILPPYSPYYSDYSGANAGKVLLIVRNLTSTQKRIKLTGELKGDNGIKISTKSTYVPLQPIILQPNETKQLNGTSLKDIFDLNSLNVYGIDKVKLVQTSRIPEGNYTFCIQAIDMNNNQTVSDVAPVGCTSFNISYPNAPILVSPMAFEKKTATTVQSLTFNWMNPGAVPINTQYIIQVVEMPDVSKDPNQVLNATSFYMLNQRIIGTSYVYGNGNVPLKVGKKYAWRVIASDPSGKTGFMNDGKSQANVFIYGDDQQLAVTNPELVKPIDLLNITAPLCKTKNEAIFVGPNTNLNLSWLWKDQIESVQLFGTLDSNLLKHYTKVNVTPVAVNAQSKLKGVSDFKLPSVYENIKSYQLIFSRKSGYSSSKATIELVISSPKQSVNLTEEQAKKLGFAMGNTYTVLIKALNENGKEIARAESCEWLLRSEIENAVPKLTVKGRLVYTFDKKNYYGVNKTTFGLQIVNDKNSKFDKNRIVYPKTGMRVQPVTYVTTDALGNFTAQIEQLSTDTGKKYIAVVTSGAYYTMIGDNVPQNNVLVEIPNLNINPNGGVITYTQEPLSIGDVKTDAYNFTLTVNLSKGFSKTINKNDFNKEYTTNGQDVASLYYASYNITNVDTMSINPKAKVDAGILVGIYRKAKKDNVPTFEGDISNPSPQFPLKAGDIRVAEARTFIKDGKTVVVFNKLLLSVASDDEYYIKAILPKANPNDKLQGDNDADLVAPEQRLAFRPANFNALTPSYNTSVNYQIISTKPPTAKIKGQIMEQWPSQPGVLHPYANKSFSVKMYTKNPIVGGQSIAIPGECQTYPAAVYQKTKDAGGKDVWLNIGSTGNSEYTVAAGKTDANGKYEIEILAFNETGSFDLEIRKESNVKEGRTCEQIEADNQAANKKKIEDQAKTVVINVPKNISEMESLIKEQAGMAGGNLGDNGSAGGEVITFDNDGKITTAGSKLLDEFGNKGGDGNPFTGGGKIDPKGGVSVNGNLANGAISGIAKVAGLAAQGIQKFLDDGIPTIITGPSNSIDEQDQFSHQPYVQQLERYFTMIGIPKVVSTINNDAGNTLEKFVVPVFGTINLGVSIINVDEVRTLKVKVSVAGQPNNNALSGAKMVVFRLEKLAEADKIYGEGSVSHPMKPLISSTYVGNKENDLSYANPYEYYKLRAGNVNVEWVLDLPLDIQSDNSFNLGDLRLSKSYNYSYYVLITPPADGKSGRFKPYVSLLSKQSTEQVIQVQPATSRISARVLDQQSQKPIPNSVVNVEIYDNKTLALSPKSFTTDQNGYFEIINGANGLSWKDNDYFRAYAIVDGYENNDKYSLSTNEKKAIKDQLFKDGNNFNFTILKKPGTLIQGVVYGPIAGNPLNPIDAYIETADGTIIPTIKVNANGVKSTGFYSFYATSKKQKLKIIPVDPGYIEETYDVEIPKGNLTKNFTLQRRMHKMLFKLQTADGQKIPNGDVQVTINNDAKLSKASLNSQVSFAFENVSINNYDIKVASNNNGNYIPKMVNFKNEESIEEQVYTIIIEKGAIIKGKVTLNGNAAKNARVYIHYNTSDAVATNVGGAKLFSMGGAGVKSSNPLADKTTNVAALEDFTDEFGNYEIKGLPVKENETIKVHVTMTADFAINGAEKDIQINNGLASADFALSTFNGPLIKNIYGFPLAVEKIEKLSETQYSVSGIVDLSKNNSAFTWANPDSKIRVSNVIVNAADGYQPTGAVPIDAIANIKMRYLDKYNVLVKKYGVKMDNVKPFTLNIEKSADGGVVNGTVSIIDNSFKYPSSYLNFENAGDFYLSTATETPLNLINIPAIYSGTKKNEKYNLSNNAGGDLAFSFINFQTTANAKKSYLGADGKFHLDINFKGEMPNSTPKTIDINIKDLVLDGNTVEPQKGSSSLMLKLQTWNLEVRDWVIDVKKGGIYSENSLIKTGIVDVPAKLFNLRSDNVILSDFDVQNVYLGGDLVKLAGIKKGTVNLVFDEAVGSDHSGHWRLSGTSLTKDPVATIAVPAVAGKFPGLNLNVNYFQFISFANENLISLSSAQSDVKLYNNNKITFTPTNIGSYVDKYAIGGSMKIDLPRVNPVAVDLMFDKTNMELGNFNLNFEGKGYVQFKNDQAKLVENKSGITKIYGFVEEPNKINPIACDLTFGTYQAGIISLTKDKILNMDGVGEPNSKSLTLKINGTGTDGMKEENKDWTTLKFSGELDDPLSDKLVVKKPFYKFEVLGDVQANADGIKMERATAFGSIKMIYDLPNRQMTGSLRMDNIAFGSYKFTGDVEVSYGAKGFLMLGAGQLNTGTLLVDGFGTFNIGMLFANTTLNATTIAKVTQYSKSVENKCWLDKYKTDFQGFFLTGGYDILNEKKGIDLGVASVYLNAVLGVEASIGASFKGTQSFKALIGAHGLVKAGMSAVTGTSINGSLAAHLTASADYSNSTINVDGRAGIAVNYDLSQYLVAKTVTYKGSIDARVLFHYQPGKTSFAFELAKDKPLPECPEN